MATEHEEDRLRQLLHDDAWSLPAWPDVEARVRRTAHRQRLHTASVSAVACALAATAVVLPLKLLGGPAPRIPVGTGSRPAVSHPATPTPRTPQRSYATPPVDAQRFPGAIYPPPRTLRSPSGTPFYCPGGNNVQPFGRIGSEQVLTVIKNLGHSLAGDLQLSDRAFWPTLFRAWQGSGTWLFFSGNSDQIQYAGPLVGYNSLRGPPDLDGLIARQCGSWLSLSTWLIVAGPPGSPALQNELLFLNRGGHVLLYYTQ